MLDVSPCCTGPASWSRSGSRRPRSMTIEATAAGVPPGGAAAGLDTRAFPSGLAGARTGVDDSCAQAQSGERGRGGTASGSRGWRPICPHSPALST
jgi:hypothetical protein